MTDEVKTILHGAVLMHVSSHPQSLERKQAALLALGIESLGFEQFLELQMHLQMNNALNTFRRTLQMLSVQPPSPNQLQTPLSTRRRDASLDTAPAA
jgi:hypothetical protein